MLKMPYIYVEPRNDKPIEWIDNKFIDCKVLFPHWICAEILLNDFVSKIEDWEVIINRSNINISLKYPEVRDIYGNYISMIEAFPPEDRDQVIEICDRLQYDYTPNLNDFMGTKIMMHTSLHIKQQIKSREQEILSYGGRAWRKELYYRLGLKFF